MGHRDIQTTMNIYAEDTEERKQSEFELLSQELDNGDCQKLHGICEKWGVNLGLNLWENY